VSRVAVALAAMFPLDEGGAGASGALAKGDVYVPTPDGAILYFRADDIDGVLARVRRPRSEPQKHQRPGARKERPAVWPFERQPAA
jgi:hypothetical protein